jgi:4'-phosphopantetheinyl transferase
MTMTLEPGAVRVWHARPNDVWATADAMQTATRWLQPAERERFERFRHASDRAMFLLGRVMARAIVGRALGVAPTAWRWREGPRGRPEIDEPAAEFSFNIAHSAGLVVCALARQVQVGVDVEHRQRPALDRAIVSRYCSPAEVADIESHGPDGWHDQFLSYWTLKEAYLKARGLGIAVPLAELSFTLKPSGIVLEHLGTLAGSNAQWAFDLRRVGPHHVVATAVSMPALAPSWTVEPLPVEWLTV